MANLKKLESNKKYKESAYLCDVAEFVSDLCVILLLAK